ncbi:MAG: carboxypeptidase-like regulatory domain-containing protein, partial [Bacteroidota bacterium]
MTASGRPEPHRPLAPEAVAWVMRIASLLALWLPLVALAQSPVAVTGQVLDAATGEPIPGANLVISGSQTGAAADLDGRFALRSELVGDHVLIVSAVGYATRTPEATLPGANLVIRLRPVDLDLGDAVVEREQARGWRRRLARFRPLFIGRSPLARQTEWTNPEVLALSEGFGGRLRANAEAPLALENRALGYRLTFHDLSFVGSEERRQWSGAVTFDELNGTDREIRRWRRARETAYRGSWRHFAAAIARGTLEEEGFVVFAVPREGDLPRVRRPLSDEDLEAALEVPDPSDPFTFSLRVYGAWMIEYTGEQ